MFQIKKKKFSQSDRYIYIEVSKNRNQSIKFTITSEKFSIKRSQLKPFYFLEKNLKLLIHNL